MWNIFTSLLSPPSNSFTSSTMSPTQAGFQKTLIQISPPPPVPATRVVFNSTYLRTSTESWRRERGWVGVQSSMFHPATIKLSVIQPSEFLGLQIRTQQLPKVISLKTNIVFGYCALLRRRQQRPVGHTFNQSLRHTFTLHCCEYAVYQWFIY